MPEDNKKEQPKGPIYISEVGLSKTTKTMPHDPSLKTLRTFKGDLEDTINDKKESKVSIITAEVKSKEEEKTKKENNSNYVSEKDIFVPRKPIITKNIIYFIGALFLISASVTSFVFIYKNKPEEKIVVSEKSIIPYSKKEEINLSSIKKEDITEAFNLQKDKFNERELSVLKVSFLNQEIPISNQIFLGNLIPSFPGDLLRSITDYMLGVINASKNNLFMVIMFDDYNRVYVGMIKWENLIKNDLSAIFKVNINSFQDEVYKNNDLRVAKDDEGKTILVYGFVDKKIMIVAPNEEVFIVLREKYINSKLVR